MEMDLLSRGSKWKREEEKRRENAKRKIYSEQIRKRAARKAQSELEKDLEQKRVAKIIELEKQEQQALEDQRKTGGINYVNNLRPYPIAADGDRLTLPVSALEELNPQNAFEQGVFVFELTYLNKDQADKSSNKRITHAGVLEFTADEGAVGIPPKVAASLFAKGENIPDDIQVRFVRLEKGTVVTLQPKGDGFDKYEINIKNLLEQSLKSHATLTIGDNLLIRHDKKTFEVGVVDLKPDSAVNILNTDLEVVLLPSDEITRALDEKKMKEQETILAKELVQQRELERKRKYENLDGEPLIDDPNQVKIALRLPNGKQQTRRFQSSSKLGAVLDFAEAVTVVEENEDIQLVSTYPRQIFTREMKDSALVDIGLQGRLVALFVEIVSTARIDEDINMDSDVESKDIKLWPENWGLAQLQWEESLDEIARGKQTPIHALEPLFPRPDTKSGNIHDKWVPQLKELSDMGFYNRSLNIELLERYQGRLLRVVNYLSELPSEQQYIGEAHN